jgi:succinate-acetate transporter protein
MTELSEPAQAPSPAPARKSLIANPVPVGVGGFALTTFTLGMYQSGFFDAEGTVLVFALAAFYGGLVQVIAGFFALAKGEVFPATFMTSYGAFWFAFVALNLYVVPHAGAAADQAVTIFLIMWTIITFIFTVCTLATNKFVFATFIVFDIAFILLDIGSAAGSETVTHIGGGFVMLLAAMAWYIVGAEIINESTGKRVVPMFPFKNSPYARFPDA